VTSRLEALYYSKHFNSNCHFELARCPFLAPFIRLHVLLRYYMSISMHLVGMIRAAPILLLSCLVLFSCSAIAQGSNSTTSTQASTGALPQVTGINVSIPLCAAVRFFNPYANCSYRVDIYYPKTLHSVPMRLYVVYVIVHRSRRMLRIV